MLKNFLFFMVVSLVCFTARSQNCGSVSGKKNQEEGIHYYTGITRSENFYSLLIQKEVTLDNKRTSRYVLDLNAASKVLLSDSILASKGLIELELMDGSKVIYENAKATNNPLGFCCMVGFKVYLPEEEIKILAANPIVQFNAFGILSTKFSSKRQKDQQEIINCLLGKK